MESSFLSEEHELSQESPRHIFKAEVRPHLKEWEAQGKIDRNIFQKMGELGYLGLGVEDAYEGAGLDFLYTTIYTRGPKLPIRFQI